MWNWYYQYLLTKRTPLRSGPRDLCHLEHLIRMMRRHELAKKPPSYIHTHLSTSLRKHPQGAILETCTIGNIWSGWQPDQQAYPTRLPTWYISLFLKLCKFILQTPNMNIRFFVKDTLNMVGKYMISTSLRYEVLSLELQDNRFIFVGFLPFLVDTLLFIIPISPSYKFLYGSSYVEVL